MAKKQKTWNKDQESIRRSLADTFNIPPEIAKKIVRALGDTVYVDSKTAQLKAADILRELRSSLQVLQDRSIAVDTTTANTIYNHYEKMTDEYINIMKRVLTKDGLGNINWRRDEIRMSLMARDILNYNPMENEAAYVTGDRSLVIKREIGSELTKQIQIKSSTDFFRIYYSFSEIRSKMKGKYPEDLIAKAEKAVETIRDHQLQFTVNDLKNDYTNKIKFMEFHKNLSAADWYIIYYKNSQPTEYNGDLNNFSALSFPAEKLINFAKAFNFYLNPVPEQLASERAKSPGDRLGKLKLNFNDSGLSWSVWFDVLTPGIIIHYSHAPSFYKHRNKAIRSHISKYNANWDLNKSGFSAIQNVYFDPIEY